MSPGNRRVITMVSEHPAVGVAARAWLQAAPWLACAAALLAACQRTPPANPHYVLGSPYQSGGTWWYPRESDNLDETGLAAVYPADHPPLTTNGEVFSQGALTAAHATLQLPAIARLTDLETGRSVLVRINDRGTPTPARLVQVTRRIAGLLGMAADGVAQVRLTVLAGPSEAAAQHVPGAPSLPIAAAPVGDVASASLPPPPGARQESGHAMVAAAAALPAAKDPTDRVPEIVTQGTPQPGRLWVRLDTFQFYQYAAMEQARLAGLAPRIDRTFEGRAESFRVMLGPFGSVAAADAAVEQAVHAGIADARIVVE
ncbi:MAG TPA: RlpA-like double-psi beta-barrel domain-containing protein [Acetobacteraceae bacterium]|nr:RlpA-like double-psi beta-barrel domain-containing protein [Acetobacteraceae bacterium]